MGLFSIFGGKKDSGLIADIASLQVDMHSHLIPGIDDGSPDMASSLEMLQKFSELGYKKLITTPHIMSDYYRNTPEIILPGLDALRQAASDAGLSITIEAAAEYYYDDSLMQKLKNKEELLTFGDKYLLFEFSFHAAPNQTDELIFEMLTQGYKPVLAHFERYAFYAGDTEQAERFREKGVNIQMNLNSLGGHYGPFVQKMAEALVNKGLVDFAGTDCHRLDHLQILERNLKLPYLDRLLQLPLKNKELLA